MANVPIFNYLRRSPFLNYRGVNERVYLLTFTIAMGNDGHYVETIFSEELLKYKHFQENNGKLNWTDTDGVKHAKSVLCIKNDIDLRSSTSEGAKYYIWKNGYKREIIDKVNDLGGGGFFKYMVNNTGDKYVLSG